MPNPLENYYANQYERMLLRYGDEATVSNVYKNLFRLSQVACLNSHLNDPEAYYQELPILRNSGDKLSEIYTERVDSLIKISYLEESKDKPVVPIGVSALVNGSPNCTIRQSPVNNEIMLELGTGRSCLDPNMLISELWDRRDILPSDIYRLLTINRILREKLKKVCTISSHARKFINSDVVPHKEFLVPSIRD